MLCASPEITKRDAAILLRGLRREPPLMTPGYLALRQHAAWIDVSARARIRVAGEDRARLLHAMTTNQIQALKPGEGCYAFFLNAQGRILADVNVLCFEDHLLLDSEPELGAKIYEHLDRYIIADDAALENLAGQTAAIAVEGPEAELALRRLGAPAPEAAGSHVAWNTRTVARLNTTGSGGYFLILASAEKAAVVDALAAAGIVEASPADARQVRIENGHPRYGEEITERYLVQETAQLQAVNFAKGCYLGQEIVERVRSRGQVHRLLRRLEMETANVPAAGSKLAVDGATAAEVASAVFSPALNKTVALAYVRAPFAEPGARLNLDGTPAVVSLPG